MHRRITFIIFVLGLLAMENSAVYGQTPYPRAGWQAQLSTFSHNVSGTATILDEDTFRVDNFTYDGGGLNGGVYFYLGASENQQDFVAGLLTGPNLLFNSFDGTEGPMVVDLPAATTLDGYSAISVWCVDASVNFGSGTFVAPEPTTFWLLSAGGVMLLSRRRTKCLPHSKPAVWNFRRN